MEKVQTQQKSGNELKKILDVSFGIAVLVGGTIGVGILRTPGSIAVLLPNYWFIIGCWVFGGIYVLMGAASVAELATMLPKAGGAYNYVKRAFGNYAGFITGWFDYITYAIAPAYFSIVIAEYLVVLFPSLTGYDTALALCCLGLFVLLHAGGVKNGSVAQKIMSVIKVLFFLTLIIACFLFTGSKPESGTTALKDTAAAGGLFFGFIKSMQLIIGTYDGWMSVCFFAEEDKNPSKNIPRSLFSGALIVMIIYVLLNIAVLNILPIATIAGSTLAASDAARVVFGDFSATLVVIIALFSLLSILNAHMMIPARILFGLSRDGFFVNSGTAINKGGTPLTALVFSSLISFILIIIGSFEQLFALGAFMAISVLGLTFASLLKLRVKEPQLHRPFHAPGYPVTTIIVLLISIGLFIGFALSDHYNLLLIIGIVGISYPCFLLVQRINNKRESVKK
ncbi:MAG TPA: APC family permease [Chitinophagaceae bacterium]|nr:APC family permease [Chitinophagaceae bacterium]